MWKILSQWMKPPRQGTPQLEVAPEGQTPHSNVDQGGWKSGMPSRFVGDQRVNESALIQAARDYSKKLEIDYPWHPDHLESKPYSAGDNESFFRLMTTAISLLKCLDLAPGSRVLEVGSGPGWLSEMMLKLGWNVDSIEPDANMAEIAKAKCAPFMMGRESFPSLNVLVGSLEEGGIPSGYYDAVVFFDSLHHIVDEVACFDKCYASLKMGGVIGISEGAWIPGAEALESALRKEMALCGTLENPFTRQYLDFCLNSAGFSAIERFVWPHLLLGEDLALAPLRSALLLPPEETNFVLAAKVDQATAEEWKVGWGAVSALWSADGASVSVQVDITNRGSKLWRKGQGPGAVAVGLSTVSTEATPQEPVRGVLNASVLPGQTLAFSAEFRVRPDCQRFVLDLVKEQEFWLSAKGADVCTVSRPSPAA